MVQLNELKRSSIPRDINILAEQDQYQLGVQTRNKLNLAGMARSNQTASTPGTER